MVACFPVAAKKILFSFNFALGVWILHFWSSGTLRSLFQILFFPTVICIYCKSLGQQEELILGHSMSNQHIEESFSLPSLMSMICASTRCKRQNIAQENMNQPYSGNQSVCLVTRFSKVF
jgi:hypothetical protein